MQSSSTFHSLYIYTTIYIYKRWLIKWVFKEGTDMTDEHAVNRKSKRLIDYIYIYIFLILSLTFMFTDHEHRLDVYSTHLQP